MIYHFHQGGSWKAVVTIKVKPSLNLNLRCHLGKPLSRITQAYTSQILRPKSQRFLLLHLRSSFFHSFHQEACIDHTTLQASHSRKVSIFTRMKEGFIIITKQKITVLTEGFELIFGALIRCQCWYLLGCIPPSQELSPPMELGGSEHLHHSPIPRYPDCKW